MTYKEAKGYEGEIMTILEMDSLFSVGNSESIFKGYEKEIIEGLRKDKESSFSYVIEIGESCFNVFFSLIEDNEDAFKIEILINNIEEF